MPDFKTGNFRNYTGWIRSRPRSISVQGLLIHSGEIDDELWAILEYYSEIESVGLEFLRGQGILNATERKAVFNKFQAYVRQAKSFYQSAKLVPSRSSPLLYYFCFHNLAKASLVVNKRAFSAYHGLKYPGAKSGNSNFSSERLGVDGGVFKELYKWYFDTLEVPRNFNIRPLFTYCTDISYQCQLAGLNDERYSFGLHCVAVDKNSRKAWSIVALTATNLLLKYPSKLRSFLRSYEKIDLPQANYRDIFDLNAWQAGKYTFFQSIELDDWTKAGSGIPLGQVNLKINSSLKDFLVTNRYSKTDLLLALPIRKNNQKPMDETMSIYILMFYLSSLVRYKPQYFEFLLSSKEAWIIENFVRSCPTTFLQGMISKTLNVEYVFENN